VNICYETDPENWWNPEMSSIANFEPRSKDYVNEAEELQKEELK